MYYKPRFPAFIQVSVLLSFHSSYAPCGLRNNHSSLITCAWALDFLCLYFHISMGWRTYSRFLAFRSSTLYYAIHARHPHPYLFLAFLSPPFLSPFFPLFLSQYVSLFSIGFWPTSASPFPSSAVPLSLTYSPSYSHENPQTHALLSR